MKTLIGVCMAAMALIGNGCMGNAKHAESVSGGTTDSLYLLVGSYAAYSGGYPFSISGDIRSVPS